MKHTHNDSECPACGDTSSWDGCTALRVARAGKTALQSLWDGSLTGERKQEILTPDWILEALRVEWGTIKRDPCANAENNTGAETFHTEADDGLCRLWEDMTYVNPPFGTLSIWLEAARLNSLDGHRIALLCPVRTHRTWYRDALDTVSAAIELPPIKFKGYAAGFPAPLHLLCWNWTPDPKLWRGTVRKLSRVM